ncbi:MAG: alpha/beta fold hydrolase, partial [Trebonia sp.]
MKIRVNGVDFNCEAEGKEGAPWVTFSHALCNNLTLWDEQAALLKDRYRVLRYDQRGHGRTRPAPGPYTFPMLIDDALALLDHFAIPKTHWVGLSIGGMMGYGIAADHGNRLLSLVACDSRPDAPPDYQAYFQHRVDVAREQGMDALAEMT